ncbi:MAG: pyridoxamine 5'-phosphate oxidase, partial [Myxococcales bacterium]|nr:pyridoxamine 5'-phosphate oxidase [Myxococcales bacterium]
MTDLASLRRDYTLASLDESEVHPNPFQQFVRWFDEARRAEVDEPNAMTLATADTEGRPSARTVLLKNVDDRGFVFFTNYESRKGVELTSNPHAALVFFWAPIERQVTIAGTVTPVAREESETYFRQRPRLSQLGAWASAQSQVVVSRAILEARFAEFEVRYRDQEVPCPPHWGGFRLTPTRLEFWQGRRNRLHDRIQYTRLDDGWRIERLCPLRWSSFARAREKIMEPRCCSTPVLQHLQPQQLGNTHSLAQVRRHHL